jgi:hypothetical protein
MHRAIDWGEEPIVRRYLAVTGATVVLAIAAAPAAARQDKDCSDFPTHRAAQRWFKHHHPRQDPSRLDADHDGIACEDLP